VLRGRALLESDQAGAEPVAVIDRVFADQEWSGEDPLGAVLLLSSPPGGPQLRARVVGVVDAMPMSRLDDVPRPTFYVPFAQAVEGHYLNWGMDVVVRGAAGPELAAAVEQAAREAFPDAAMFNLTSMHGVIDQSLAGRRFQLLLLSGFGLVALILSMVGVTAVLLVAVKQRNRELGVRLALGAHPTQLWWRVQREGLGLVVGGALLGIGAALLASRAFASLVYGISVRDPIAFTAGPGALAAVGFVAALIPAVRAMRVDPARMLREE
jgi:hypothetical protein